MNIGVLSLQGGVIEHINHIESLGHKGVQVKSKEDLDDIDAIILPGGESTTMGRLLNVTGMMEPLRNKIEQGMPVWGTCAGMILMAKNIENDDRRHLATMDITVRRNAFGRQIDSFKTKKKIKCIGEDEIEIVFIRAPYVVDVGNDVEVMCEVDGNIVAVREKNMIATSFHPELTDDLSFLRYFIENIA